MKNKLMKLVTVMIVALTMIVNVLSVVAVDNQGETAGGEAVSLENFNGGTITVTGLAKGDVAYLYKVIDIKYDAGTNNVTKEWGSTTIGELAAKHNWKSVEEYSEANGAKTLYADLVTDIFKGTPSWVASKKAENSTEVTFENIKLGQYMVIVTGANVYAPMTATFEPEVDKDENKYIVYSNVNIVAKASNPTLDKSIVDGRHGTENDSVAIGDTVNFKLVTQVPAFPEEAVDKTFRLIDTMEKGIIGANGIRIVINGTNPEKELVLNEDYRVSYYNAEGTKIDDAENASKFKIDFKINACPEINGKTITVTYNSKVTAEIVPGEPELNKVKLIWPKNVWEAADKKLPGDKEPENDTENYNDLNDEVKVFTYGLKILKVDGADEPLPGAAFKILKGSQTGTPVNFVKVADGSYRVAGSEDKKEDIVNTDLNCDDEAKLILAGLDEGEYWIVETVVPTGYVQAEPQKITITDTQKEGENILTGIAKESTKDPRDAYADATVKNTKGFNLPKTGGAGTTIFTIIGIALMGGALLLVVRMRKANGAK